MTLAAIIDLIPPDQHDSATIYRVKPLDQFDTFRNKIHIRKRYVVILEDGYSICSCLQGRNLGIPCRHFFAVLNRFRLEIAFNIDQIHPHWLIPDKRIYAMTRDWIYGDLIDESTGTSADQGFSFINPYANEQSSYCSFMGFTAYHENSRAA